MIDVLGVIRFLALVNLRDIFEGLVTHKASGHQYTTQNSVPYRDISYNKFRVVKWLS